MRTRLQRALAPPSHRIALVAAGAVLALMAARAAAGGLHDAAVTNAGWTGFAVFALAASLRVYLAEPRRDRSPWGWVLAGSAAWAAGQIARDLQLVVDAQVAGPLPDLGLLLAGPFYLIGSISFLALRGQRLAVYALLLDVGAVLLTLVAGAALYLSDQFTAAIVADRTVPALGFVHAAVWVAATGAGLSMVWGLPTEQARRAHVWLLAGIGLNAFASVVALPDPLGGLDRPGRWHDGLWMLGMAFIGVGALSWVEDISGGVSGALPASWLRFSRMILPGAVAVIGAFFLVSSQFHPPRAGDPIVIVSVALVIPIVALRAGLALFTNWRLGERQRRRAVQYQALYEVGLATAGERSLDELVRTIVDRATELTGGDGALLALREEGRYVVRALRKPSPDLRDSVGEPFQGIGVLAIQTRDVVSAPDYRAHPDSNPKLHDVIASALSVPLLARGEVIGVLTSYSSTPREFPPETQRLTRLYAAQAAIAIENARLLEESRRLARDDDLTGVLNRRSLMARLDDEIAEASRHGDVFGVVLCDVDGLKTVNDDAGHLVGNEVLTRVARVLRESARAEDVVARFGGDEFVLLLPRTGLLQAQALVSRLRSQLAAETYHWAGRDLPLPRVSFGVAWFPEDGRIADALLAVADERMYEDKAAGRVVGVQGGRR